MPGIFIAILVIFVLQLLINFGLRKMEIDRSTSTKWRFWLIFLGVSAAITMFGADIISVTMISIIGIPIGIYLMIAPFLFLLMLGTHFIRSIIGTNRLNTGAAFVATLGLLAIPPYVANGALDTVAQAQVAADRDDGTKPQGRTFAVRNPRLLGKSRDTIYCDGFCQRALMNGVAARVLVLEQGLDAVLDPSLLVDSFRFEKRAACSPVRLPIGIDPLEIQEDRRAWQGKRVDDWMQLEISNGNCLISEKVPLGTADVVLSVGTSKAGDSKIRAGLSLFADTVTADRIAMHEKQGTSFVETYRKTFVKTYKLVPFYAPSAEFGVELRMHRALWRYLDKINIGERHDMKPVWTAFLVQRLGLDLALRR